MADEVDIGSTIQAAAGGAFQVAMEGGATPEEAFEAGSGAAATAAAELGIPAEDFQEGLDAAQGAFADAMADGASPQEAMQAGFDAATGFEAPDGPPPGEEGVGDMAGDAPPPDGDAPPADMAGDAPAWGDQEAMAMSGENAIPAFDAAPGDPQQDGAPTEDLFAGGGADGGDHPDPDSHQSDGEQSDAASAQLAEIEGVMSESMDQEGAQGAMDAALKDTPPPEEGGGTGAAVIQTDVDVP